MMGEFDRSGLEPGMAPPGRRRWTMNRLRYSQRPRTAYLLFLAASIFVLTTVGDSPARAQQFETAKLLPADGYPFDNFGSSVSLSGERALIGSLLDDDNGGGSGSAYLFRYDSPTGRWHEEAKLLASDGAPYDYFGVSVALSGDRALVGAFRDEDNGQLSGSAYLFAYDSVSGTWQEEAKLLASDGSSMDEFGFSVALSDETALVGSDGDGDLGDSSGSAYLFGYDSVSGWWQEEAKLLASDGQEDDHFGYSVALDNDIALIGAFGDDDNGSYSGSAYLFRYDPPSGTWQEEAKLLASDGAPYDYLGVSVALFGDRALVGAYGDDDAGVDAGAAYLFRYDGASGTWQEEAKLVAHDGSVADGFGASVALTGDRALVGAYNDDDIGPGSGSAYLFRHDGVSGTWQEEAKLIPSDLAKNDLFGWSVGLTEQNALAGARNDDDSGMNSGSAYIVDFSSVLEVDIMCNGQDSDVQVGIGQTATVTIEITNGYHPGLSGDLWVVAQIPFSPWNWWSYGPFPNPHWYPNTTTVYYTGPGVNHSATVFDLSPPPGTYHVFLALDSIPDGLLNLFALWDHDVVDFTVN